jgi:L-lysine exporter family protein LysE/ArgO
MLQDYAAHFAPFATGFAIGGGLIIAIGAQNAFILRQGLLKQHVFPLVLFCAISDALLIIAGVAGLGALVQQSPLALQVVAIGGALFLIWYGIKAFRRSQTAQSLDLAKAEAPSLRAALGMCAAFTWANPHVYLDTVVLVGSLSAPFSGSAKIAYAVGASTASFAWFFSLGYGARLLVPLFAKPATWRYLDLGIAAVMWLIAAKLLWGLFA